jgi:hypothetical protein
MKKPEQIKTNKDTHKPHPVQTGKSLKVQPGRNRKKEIVPRHSGASEGRK